MINTSNYTRKDNSSGRAGPTWPSVPATSAQTSRTAAHKTGSLGGALVTAVQVLLSWLAGFPRRVGDQLFAMNDTEAYWRDWQTIRIHGGLGRRYRDSRFDALAECSHCSGTGRGTGVIAALPCLPCAGTGRIAREEVS